MEAMKARKDRARLPENAGLIVVNYTVPTHFCHMCSSILVKSDVMIISRKEMALYMANEPPPLWLVVTERKTGLVEKLRM